MTNPPLHNSDPSRASRTPYAGPHAGLSANANVSGPSEPMLRQPYIPAALRSRPDAVTAGATYHSTPHESVALVENAPNTRAESLPWISEFLAPAASAESENGYEASARSGPGSAENAAGAAGAAGAADAATAADAANAPAAEPDRTDDWPFADAGAQASELSIEMPSPDPFADALLSGATPAALPMWNDDDMMDIMPVHTSYDSADREATEAAEQQEHSETAARALEALAARVRGGELALPGYASEMGDAAALAAALAALLGVRH